MDTPKKEYKDYLGDGVYVDFDGVAIKMTANGIGAEATDTIFLDDYVVEAFQRYVKRLEELKKE